MEKQSMIITSHMNGYKGESFYWDKFVSQPRTNREKSHVKILMKVVHGKMGAEGKKNYETRTNFFSFWTYKMLSLMLHGEVLPQWRKFQQFLLPRIFLSHKNVKRKKEWNCCLLGWQWNCAYERGKDRIVRLKVHT